MKMILTAAVAISWLLTGSITFASHHSDDQVAKFIAPDGKVTSMHFSDIKNLRQKRCSGVAGPELACWMYVPEGVKFDGPVNEYIQKAPKAYLETPDGKKHLLVARSHEQLKKLKFMNRK